MSTLYLDYRLSSCVPHVRHVPQYRNENAVPIQSDTAWGSTRIDCMWAIWRQKV